MRQLKARPVCRRRGLKAAHTQSQQRAGAGPPFLGRARPGSAGRSNAAAHDGRKDTETTSAQAFIKCWLHPEFQQAGQGEQAALATGAEDADEGEDETADVKPTQAAVVQRPWPTGLTEQIKAVAEVLAGAGRSLDLEGLAGHFNRRGRWRDRLPTLLDTLAALGRARAVGDGRWVDAGI